MKKDILPQFSFRTGSTLSYAYDGNGNLISYTDANGAVTKYEYDDAHRMTAWYDANGTRIVQKCV